MKKILIVVLLIGNMLANDKLNLDLDADGIKDEVWLEYGKKRNYIVYTLSSLGKITFKSDALEPYNSSVISLKKSKNGFKYVETFMRGGTLCQFRYEKKSRKMRLIGIEYYSFGNASHIGKGESSANLLTGDYVSQWAYVDYEINSLIVPPKTTKNYHFDKIYLDNFYAFIENYDALDNGEAELITSSSLKHLFNMLKNKKEKEISEKIKTEFKGIYTQIKSLVKCYDMLSFVVIGDLNKDESDDIVLYVENNHATKLLVFIKEKRGYKLVSSNIKLPHSYAKLSEIERELEDTENIINSIKIEKQLLYLNFSILSFNTIFQGVDDSYKFEYRNKNMKLIGAELLNYHRASGNGERESINYVTGKKELVKVEELKRVGKSKWTDIKSKKLMLLENFEWEYR